MEIIISDVVRITSYGTSSESSSSSSSESSSSSSSDSEDSTETEEQLDSDEDSSDTENRIRKILKSRMKVATTSHSKSDCPKSGWEEEEDGKRENSPPRHYNDLRHKLWKIHKEKALKKNENFN